MRRIESADPPWMQAGFADMGWSKPPRHFQDYLEAQESGEIVVFVASVGTEYAGHVTLWWQSASGIPEIRDLNVLPRFRRQGIGNLLLESAEATAFGRSGSVQISVGLHPGYGAAQRLYVMRGYVPDAEGVTYLGRSVEEGQVVRMDDELLFHFTKDDPRIGR